MFYCEIDRSTGEVLGVQKTDVRKRTLEPAFQNSYWLLLDESPEVGGTIENDEQTGNRVFRKRPPNALKIALAFADVIRDLVKTSRAMRDHILTLDPSAEIPAITISDKAKALMTKIDNIGGRGGSG